ncbi:MAG: hypothetical protein KAU14_02940, partial [Thermoplasmata archaeon]|nr:hypothetical protein [Thermoplasmata archaeon]
DPFNPDTDGDGIEDPDDPTPKGSLINEEEIWETFEVEVEPSQKFSTVDEEIEIEVRVEKNGIPIAGRKVWLFIYFDDDGLEKIKEESGILSDGKANFSFCPEEAGSCAFLAIVNRSAVSPGREISYGEMNQIEQRKQGGYVYFEVFPDYKTTISSHYRNILAKQKGRFFIRKWGYSRDLAAGFSGTYPSMGDIYEPTPGKVYVSIGKGANVAGSYEVQVSKEGSNWSHTFSRDGYYKIAASAYRIDSSWAQDPWKFSYPYARITVHDTLVTWLGTPRDAEVVGEYSIKVHRVYLDVEMGAELFNDLYPRYSMKGIAQNYPEHTIPWEGTAYFSLLYQRSSYSLLLKQETVPVNGEGGMSYLFDTPGSHLATLSFHSMPAYPKDQRFKLYDRHHNYYRLA